MNLAKINIGDVNIYYELKGHLESDETVVFLNGVMASTSSWNNQVPIFENDFKILLHDFKGQLRSDKPVGPYTFKEHAYDLKVLLDYLDIKKAHFIGTSYGGEVGMRFAIDFPEFVKTLSIIDSVSELDEVLKGMVSNWKTLALKDPSDFFSGMVPTIYGNEFMKKNHQFLEVRAKGISTIKEDYFTGQIYLYDTFLNDVNMTDELNNIKCKTLVICGENDILKPRKFSDIIVSKINQCEYALIPNCGHVTIFEQPDVLNSLLLGFIVKNK
ncbi:alpha/beta hydrolase [Mycoplasmatota bacterium]|nr:alpha/beta hydrolase [Mycoplasmatota bacterium]